jgi:hypothetical protein
MQSTDRRCTGAVGLVPRRSAPPPRRPRPLAGPGPARPVSRRPPARRPLGVGPPGPPRITLRGHIDLDGLVSRRVPGGMAFCSRSCRRLPGHRGGPPRTPDAGDVPVRGPSRRSDWKGVWRRQHPPPGPAPPPGPRTAHVGKPAQCSSGIPPCPCPRSRTEPPCVSSMLLLETGPTLLHSRRWNSQKEIMPGFPRGAAGPAKPCPPARQTWPGSATPDFGGTDGH